MLNSLVLSQPEWSHINERGTFLYTKDDAEELRQLHNPSIQYSNEDQFGREFYSLNEESSLNFVSFKIGCQNLSTNSLYFSSMGIGSLIFTCTS